MIKKNPFSLRLASLVEEARTSAPKSIYIALYMVNACWLHGKERTLARHICKFGELTVAGTQITEASKLGSDYKN